LNLKILSSESFWGANYDILDELHEPVLKIEGPCCIFDEFKILTFDKTHQIGSIKRVYADCLSIFDRFSADCKQNICKLII